MTLRLKHILLCFSFTTNGFSTIGIFTDGVVARAGQRGAVTMIIKKLEITGFKSFREKTVFHFSPGVSAVVGPNGCGKSNVVDAIRWAMGEQRVRSLRGKRMEDVIFNGSESAPAVGMAEVSLLLEANGRTFSGTFGAFPEITVTRRIYRNEESEYLINQVPCRLMDIREFFMDSGVGVRTYSIVEQESISRLVEAKPEDIREFIEEAAGIVKYKSRREAATRKLEATAQNMDRLKDILAEVKNRLDQVVKQVKRVEEYRRLREKVKAGDMALACQAFSRILERKNLLLRRKEDVTDGLCALKSGLGAREAALEEGRRELLEMEEDLFRLQESVFRLTNEIRTREQRIEFSTGKIRDLEERKGKGEHSLADLENRRDETVEEVRQGRELLSRLEGTIAEKKAELLETQESIADLCRRDEAAQAEQEQAKTRHFEKMAEVGRLKNGLQNLARALEDLESRRARETREFEELERRLSEVWEQSCLWTADLEQGQGTLDALRKEMEAAGENLGGQKRALEKLGEELSAFKGELAEKKSRHDSLQELWQTYEWCGEGTRSVMAARRKGRLPAEGILGVLADHLEVSRDYEPALEAVLGERLQHILVKDHEEGVRAIDYLKETVSGRGNFVPLELGNGRKHRDNGQPPRGSVRLRAFVQAKEPFDRLLDVLLDDVLLVPDLSTAVGQWNRNGFTGTLVTPDGDIVDRDGILSGGTRGNGKDGHLKNKREMAELAEAVAALQALVEKKLRDRVALQEAIGASEKVLSRTRAEMGRLELAVQGKKKDIERLDGERKWLEKRFNVLRFNKESLDSEKSSAEKKVLDYRERLSGLETEARALEEDLKTLREAWKEIRGDLALCEEELTEGKVLLSSLEERRRGTASHVDRQEKIARETSRQIEAIKKDMVTWAKEVSGLTRSIEEDERALKETLGSLEKREEERSALKAAHDEKEAALRSREGDIRELRKKIDETSGELNRLEVQIGQANYEADILEKGLYEKHQVSLEPSMSGFQGLSEEEEKKLEESVLRYRRRVENFGEINLLAEQEHGELKERHDFLSTQLEDLNASMETLKKTISKMNALSRQKFMETFTDVSRAFENVFPRIFPGGKGELRLTDPSNLLETGVDMDVQITGKKRQNLSLLSGGEKALCAISLIFSILVHRSSPFLILDEVDAPLDDANVNLFKKLVREIADTSQVILVTHNKKTMETSDNLIGVTMEKSGISSTVSVSLQ